MIAPATAPRPTAPPLALLRAAAPPDYTDVRRQIQAVDMIALAQRINVSGLQRAGRDYVGCCPLPGHADSTPSCHFYSDPTRGWFCYGECHRGGDAVNLLQAVYGWTFGQALAFLGIGDGPRPAFVPLASRPVAPRTARRAHPDRDPDVVYDYDGVYQVCRWQLTPAEQAAYGGKTKTFSQRRPDGHGGWIPNIDGVAPRLYHQAEIEAADPALPVAIGEGEKCVDALRAAGWVATCNSGGAGNWSDTYALLFTGRDVVIFADNDPAGQQHAADVAASLRPYAASIKIVTLPGLPPKGDVADLLGQGWHPDAIRMAALYTAPLPTVEVDPETGAFNDPDQDTYPALLATIDTLRRKVDTAQAEADRLRRERDLANDMLRRARRIFRNPALPDGVKLTTYTALEEVHNQQQKTGYQGGPVPLLLLGVAERRGASPDSVGEHVKYVSGANGLWERTVETDENGHKRVLVALKPDWEDRLDQLAPPEGKQKAGGKREKRQECPDCGSENLIRTITVHCGDCNAVLSETIEPVNPPVNLADATPQLAAWVAQALGAPVTFADGPTPDPPTPPVNLPDTTVRQPGGKLTGGIVNTRSAGAVLEARAAHRQLHPPPPAEPLPDEPPAWLDVPHPADCPPVRPVSWAEYTGQPAYTEFVLPPPPGGVQ